MQRLLISGILFFLFSLLVFGSAHANQNHARRCMFNYKNMIGIEELEGSQTLRTPGFQDSFDIIQMALLGSSDDNPLAVDEAVSQLPDALMMLPAAAIQGAVQESYYYLQVLADQVFWGGNTQAYAQTLDLMRKLAHFYLARKILIRSERVSHHSGETYSSLAKRPIYQLQAFEAEKAHQALVRSPAFVFLAEKLHISRYQYQLLIEGLEHELYEGDLFCGTPAKKPTLPGAPKLPELNAEDDPSFFSPKTPEQLAASPQIRRICNNFEI